MDRQFWPLYLVRWVTSFLLLIVSYGYAQPNVVFIMSDDLTATALGSYGNPVVQTPNLNRLASEGIQFNNAYAQYPVCGPSRASIMTGIYPKALGALTNGSSNFRNSHPNLVTLPQLFRQNGYVTARVSKIFHMGVPGDILNGSPGLDDPQSWDMTVNIAGPENTAAGFYEDLSPGALGPGADFVKIESTDGDLAHADGMATSQAIDLLNQFQSQPDPFFLAVGMVRPHVPLVAPEQYFGPYPHEEMTLPLVPPGDLNDIPGPARTQANSVKYGMSEEQQRKAVAAYYASVSYMDAQVGRIVDTLDELELRDDTMVVFMSDHGYNLGEHTMWQKLSLFEDTVRVPLIVSPTGGASGASSSKIVEMTDLYPTLVEMAGLTLETIPHGIHGQSFAGLIDNPASPDWTDEVSYTITQNQSESIRTSAWRLNRWNSSTYELYDQVNDPGEFTNLANDPEYASVVASLDAQMTTMRIKAATIPQAGNPATLRGVQSYWDFEGARPFDDKVGLAHGAITNNTTVLLNAGHDAGAAMRTGTLISGADDIVTLNSSQSYQPTDEAFSMSYWFNIANDGTSAPRGIFDFSGNGNDGVQSLYIGNSSELAFRVDGDQGFALAKFPMAEDGNWHFVVANFDPDGNLELHVDGVGVDVSVSAASVGNVLLDATQLLGTFNLNDTAEEKGLNGRLDAFGFYRGLLSNAQILGLFRGELHPYDIVPIDFDANGNVGCEDIDALVAVIANGSNDPYFDLTGDGRVDLEDRDVWLTMAGAHLLPSGSPFLIADATLDGTVDVSDFNAWNSHKFTSTASWCSGDFNADGVVDVSDFNEWNARKFTNSDTAVVPEPANWMLGLTGWFFVATTMRRRFRS